MSTTRGIIVLALVLCSCGAAAEDEREDDTSKMVLASALADACPPAAPDDRTARDRCADALTELAALRDALVDPMLWEAQPGGMPLERVIDDAPLMELTPLAWRRLYLSTFMFTGGPPSVEDAGKYRVLRMPVQFRNTLDAGEYPYPFWHSAEKWRSYETTTELLFYFEGEQIVAAVRSDRLDPSCAHFPRVWDGAWTWDDGREPRKANFAEMFSEQNPHVARLETAYRKLEDVMVNMGCTSCHNPSGSANGKRLMPLNYPNLALAARHGIVDELEQNLMPPGAAIADQIVRFDLLKLSLDFAHAGDDALAFEGEPVASAN